jgi:hypothetical protein
MIGLVVSLCGCSSKSAYRNSFASGACSEDAVVEVNNTGWVAVDVYAVTSARSLPVFVGTANQGRSDLPLDAGVGRSAWVGFEARVNNRQVYDGVTLRRRCDAR